MCGTIRSSAIFVYILGYLFTSRDRRREGRLPSFLHLTSFPVQMSLTSPPCLFPSRGCGVTSGGKTGGLLFTWGIFLTERCSVT